MFQLNMLEGREQQDQHQQQLHLQEMINTNSMKIENMMKATNDLENDNLDGGLAASDNHELNQQLQKRIYYRHTQHQIQQMEVFFNECPHPDDKQRKELARELGLEPQQIKFWFQNKRTQMKTQHERHENTHLRMENEKLRVENIMYKEALSTASCPTCGGPATLHNMSYEEHQLKIENARLREEIERISEIVTKHVGKPLSPPHNLEHTCPSHNTLDPPTENFEMQLRITGGEMYGSDDAHRSMAPQCKLDKNMISALAFAAMEELITKAELGHPLWVQGLDRSTEILSEDEYLRMFGKGIGPMPFGLKSEATREIAMVTIKHISLVEILMEVIQWMSMFSSIISRAATLEILTPGVPGNYDGVLQVMSAEYKVPTPFIPTRESYFVRFCKRHQDGIWGVVDISLDSLHPGPMVTCRRRPSGCLIQEMPNGCSKVIWVEHVEVDNRKVHNMYKPLVNSGLAFGAKRWLSILDRKCERLASIFSNNIPYGDTVLNNQEGRVAIVKLAEKMMTTFCNGVCASSAYGWSPVTEFGIEGVRVMTKSSADDPWKPNGTVLSASTSFLLPLPPNRVFDVLRHENSLHKVLLVFKSWASYFYPSTTTQWDILAHGALIQELAHITSSREPNNYVSLLITNNASTIQTNIMLLQESCTDPTCSLVLYAPVDNVAMNMIISGGSPNKVRMMPCGFSIFSNGSGGSLITVAFQIFIDSIQTTKLSMGLVPMVDNLMTYIAERIKDIDAMESV